MKLDEVLKIRQETAQRLKEAKIAITPEEAANIEVADFGLGDIRNIGLEVVTYVNTDRYCAKELVLSPYQICPEHRHPTRADGAAGKQETFRCRAGEVWVYVAGEPAASPKAVVPEKYKPYMTVWHEIVLRPGEQYTLKPDSLHWFQAGKEGCIVSEFSSNSDDESDIFTDPNIKRLPTIE